jgi:hypothetical protein
MTRALLIALALTASCKKAPPKGDLPPATDWQSGAAVAKPGADNPHAAVPNGTPHAAMPNDNPHAAMPNDSTHAGLGDGAHGAAPQPTGPRALEKLPDGKFAMGPFSLAPPADWTTKPTTSNMRAGDFLLPGKPGAEAELIVYYFGSQGAGTVEDNVNRWVDQFQQPDGKPSRDVAKIEKTKFGGQGATYVSLTGRYVNQGMPGGGDPVDKPDQALLAAIVDSPQGPYYFKLVGAKTTVDANAKAFRSMLESLSVR